MLRLDILTLQARFNTARGRPPTILHIPRKDFGSLIDLYLLTHDVTKNPDGTCAYLGMEVSFIPVGMPWVSCLRDQ